MAPRVSQRRGDFSISWPERCGQPTSESGVRSSSDRQEKSKSPRAPNCIWGGLEENGAPREPQSAIRRLRRVANGADAQDRDLLGKHANCGLV